MVVSGKIQTRDWRPVTWRVVAGIVFGFFVVCSDASLFQGGIFTDGVAFHDPIGKTP
jgi:hypothetical protein